MPIYNFQCDDCETIFDVRASFKEKEAGLKPECPQCHSQNAHQRISAGWFVVSDQNSANVAQAPSCGCSPGGGCCG